MRFLVSTGGVSFALFILCSRSIQAVALPGPPFDPAGATVERGAVDVDDGASFAAAVATGRPLRLKAGLHTYAGPPLTVRNDLTFEPGARLACGSSNLQLTGSVAAGRFQIFASGCTPKLSDGAGKLGPAFPEWWGAIGDYADGGPGTGTDSTAALQNAIDSGVGVLQLGAGAAYRFSTLRVHRSNFALLGISRDTSRLIQDDPTGRLDGIVQDGHQGGLTVADIGFSRLGAGIGSALSGYPYSGGRGYSVGDVLAVTGGTARQAAALTVDAVDEGGAILAVHVSTAGVYSRAPAGLLALSSRFGQGAELWVTWAGPSLLRFEDSYFVQILRNQFGGAGWDGIGIDSVDVEANKFYIRGNQIFGMANDGISAAGTAAVPVGDIDVEGQNYIQQSGRAGLEFTGRVDGSFVTDNAVFANAIGIIADTGPLAPGSINDLKVRNNDVDSNTVFSVWFKGVSSSHYQGNWTSAAGGRFVCTLCQNLSLDGNHTEGPGAGVTLNGAQNVEGSGTLFAGGSQPLVINPYRGTASKFISFSGGTWAFGSGAYATFGAASPAPDFVTIGAQIDPNERLTAGGRYPAHLTILGSTGPSDINDQASSRVLWGEQNRIFQRNGAAGGYGNAVNGYAGLALGQYHDLRGAYSQLRGLEAADHGLFGLDCWANGAATSSISASYAGQSQSCRTVLFATIASGGTGRLTADGNLPSGTNVANVDEGMARNMSLQLVARDVSTPVNSYAWTMPVALLTRAGAPDTTALALGTPSVATTGRTSGAAVSATADTTNSGLALRFTAPPGSDMWRVTAVINDAEQWH